jgi:predicted transposase/invertase (TIGR01784 family)
VFFCYTIRKVGDYLIKRLKPKNDFIFQKLFGEEEAKESLISLLNAVLRLQGPERIVDLFIIKNKQLDQEAIDDKTGRLDIRAETLDHHQFDVEMQLTNQKNMPRRTLFYLSKMYVESIKAGGKYEDLKRTVTINIVDFNLFNTPRFHTTFHFYEDHEEALILTDAMEIHFIEYSKFLISDKDHQDPLHRWLLFLDEDLPEQTLKELMEMDPVIKKTEERLEWLSGDAETQRLYEFREHSLIERNSIISESKAEGKAEMIRLMLQNGIEPAKIAEMTGRTVAEIEKMI